MKVRIELKENLKEPCAVIYAARVDEEVSQLAALIGGSRKEDFLVLLQGEKYVVVHPDEIYMVRIENQGVVLYGKDQIYRSKLRLYEMEERLGDAFFRISKTTLVNLRRIDSVEPSFGGTMYLKLKNGCKDSISRKYLPGFKHYFGI